MGPAGSAVARVHPTSERSVSMVIGGGLVTLILIILILILIF
jgi:flagellar biogenesis protein FliO